MNLKHIASTIAASMLLAIVPAVPANAEYTFSTVQDFLDDVMTVAVSGIDASSAIDTVTSDISVSGEQVLYKGATIGYWSDTVDTTLYADSAKTEPLIEKSGSGYEVDPDILELLLTDVNVNISESYTPNTADWSKIVGKYDITLGDVIIPADQWIEMDSIQKEWQDNMSNTINLTNIAGLRGDELLGNCTDDDSLALMSWMVDSNGRLFLQSGLFLISAYMNGSSLQYRWFTDSVSKAGSSGFLSNSPGQSNANPTDYPYLRVMLKSLSTDMMSTSGNPNMFTKLYLTNSTNTDRINICVHNESSPITDGATLRLISDPSVTNASDVTTCKVGFVYIRGSQLNLNNSSEIHAKHVKMFESYSCSKLVRGNTQLTKRIAKLDSLSATDFLTIKDSGWSVNGTTSIDDYIATQTLTEAGIPASMDGSVEIEERYFKVVVPSSLPMSADLAGNVLTATNAAIYNKSNADVKITDLSITAADGSNWTLVEGDPSTVRGSNEFSFETSLSTGDVIAHGEELGFTYRAKMSPAEIGVTQADIVTITVTLDWTE